MRPVLTALLSTILLSSLAACAPADAVTKNPNGSSGDLDIGGDGSDGSDGSDGTEEEEVFPYTGTYSGGAEMGIWLPEYDWGEDCDSDEALVEVEEDGAFDGSAVCTVDMGRGSRIEMDVRFLGEVADDGGIVGEVLMALDQEGYEWEEVFELSGDATEDGDLGATYEEARVYGEGRDEFDLVFWGSIDVTR